MKKLNLIFAFFIFVGSIVGQQKVQTNFSAESKQEAKKIIESYRQRVIKGEDMAEMARSYSEDPGSAGKGGLYVGIKKGVMVPEFENVAFSLKQGQVSQVFETEYGYHFIQLVQRRGDVVDVRHILVVSK